VSRIRIREPFLGDVRAAYELRFRARRQGSARPSIRLDFYRFDAGGLSIATSSEKVGRTTVRLSVPSDRRWHELAVPLNRPRGADYVLPHFVLDPTGSASAFSIDDVAIIERRRASGPRHPQALEYLENVTLAPVGVSLAAYPVSATS
jgi:hypothetical protein